MRCGFWLFFIKSISRRKARIFIASVSVALAVAILTALIGITTGISEKVGAELKAYGANIIVSPLEGDVLDYQFVDPISRLDAVHEVTGQVYGTALINNQIVEIIGLDPDSLRDKGWRLYGKWPEKKSEILAGINLRDALKLETGKSVMLKKERSPKPAVRESAPSSHIIRGFIEKGGTEDSSFVMALPDAWELLGLNEKASAILVSGASGKLDTISERIRNMIPGTEVKTLRQVAYAEESLLRKIQLLMVLVTLVVLFAASMSIASTMGAHVLERREEIGLMKAMGAVRAQISLFYRTEAVLTGLLGGAAGHILGYALAQAVSKGAFHSYITLPFYVSLLSPAFGILISVIAGHFPVRDALRQSPAVILRGE